MSKEEFVASLSKRFSRYNKNTCFINITQFSEALGISRDQGRVLLSKVQYIQNGREKLYFVEQAALAIWARQKI